MASTRTPRIDATTFYGKAPTLHPHTGWLRRVAANRFKLGGLLVGLGFWAVFINQAPLPYQIVLGAPIFEEFFKVGLALLLVSLLRIRLGVLRWLVGAIPGAGFGVLEHYISWWTEPAELFLWRVVFHSGSSALGMATYHVLEPLLDTKVRFGMTVPGTLIHYTNNVAAVVLLVFWIAGAESAEAIGRMLSISLAALSWGLGLLFLSTAEWWRVRLARRFPPPAPPRVVATAVAPPPAPAPVALNVPPPTPPPVNRPPKTAKSGARRRAASKGRPAKPARRRPAATVPSGRHKPSKSR